MSENLNIATSEQTKLLPVAAIKTAEVKPIKNQKEMKTNEEKKNLKKADSKKLAAEDLQKEIEKKQKELQKTLAELAEKQDLNNKRSIFIDAVDRIEETKKTLLEETENFESSEIMIQARNKNSSYRDDSIFTIKNPQILVEVFDFLTKKIKDRIDVIEAQLIK